MTEFGTCFFEQYAQISLSALLGSEFDSLVNKDRPDLQSPDGKSIGIEVTRAMEESKSAQMALLKDVAGLTKGECLPDIDQMLEYGYGFGLRCGKYLGLKDCPCGVFWKVRCQRWETASTADSTRWACLFSPVKT